jgi:hypothetical protein
MCDNPNGVRTFDAWIEIVTLRNADLPKPAPQAITEGDDTVINIYSSVICVIGKMPARDLSFGSDVLLE